MSVIKRYIVEYCGREQSFKSLSQAEDADFVNTHIEKFVNAIIEISEDVYANRPKQQRCLADTHVKAFSYSYDRKVIRYFASLLLGCATRQEIDKLISIFELVYCEEVPVEPPLYANAPDDNKIEVEAFDRD